MALLRADWTRRDPEITRALAALGRTAYRCTFYTVRARSPLLLPEVLQQQTVLDALASL